MPVSGDASKQDSKGTVYELKYVSDFDGMFNFLIGGINISQDTYSFYDVYASGITLNALSLPSAISGSTRSAFRGVIICAQLGATQCASALGLDPTTATVTAATGAGLLASLQPVVDGYAANSITTTTAAVAHDMISRIDGLYTEFFHNDTPKFTLDAKAIFTEFYFDVADNHKLTFGLRYNEDRKSVTARATFYEIPLISNWNTAA